MQAIWKGVISFGLVSIPVGVYPAVRKEEIRFRMMERSLRGVVRKPKRKTKRQGLVALTE